MRFQQAFDNKRSISLFSLSSLLIPDLGKNEIMNILYESLQKMDILYIAESFYDL